MVRKLVIISLLFFIYSCSQKNKQEDKELIYYEIVNKELKQQILNYVDSAKNIDVEKMLSVEFYFRDYEDDKRTMQCNISYDISAFNIINSACVFANIDTLVISIIGYDIAIGMYLPEDIGWKYLKDIFKKDYQYYLDNLKSYPDSIREYPVDFCENRRKYKIPNWILIFEDEKLKRLVIYVKDKKNVYEFP
jgi:hypothetical protein